MVLNFSASGSVVDNVPVYLSSRSKVSTPSLSSTTLRPPSGRKQVGVIHTLYQNIQQAIKIPYFYQQLTFFPNNKLQNISKEILYIEAVGFCKKKKKKPCLFSALFEQVFTVVLNLQKYSGLKQGNNLFTLKFIEPRIMRKITAK